MGKFSKTCYNARCPEEDPTLRQQCLTTVRDESAIRQRAHARMCTLAHVEMPAHMRECTWWVCTHARIY